MTALRALVASVGLALSGCATAPPPAAATPPPREVADDWRTLAPLPFGSRLQDLGPDVHEVLLFDAGTDSGPPLECYAAGGRGVRLLRLAAQDLVFCYAHEHLARIEFLLRPSAGFDEAEFARHCDDWQRQGSPGPRSPTRCEASTAGQRFLATLIAAPADNGAQLSIVILDPNW